MHLHAVDEPVATRDASAPYRWTPALSPFACGAQNCPTRVPKGPYRMRMNVVSRLVLLGAAIPLTSLVVACGGGGSDKKVALDDWVEDLCKIAIDFDEASDKAGEKFEDADLDDTKDAKKAFAESIKEQKDAQKEFRSDFDKLGQPDIEDGDKVVDAFKDQFEENDKLTEDVEKAVKDIDDDDDFIEEFMKIADDFDTPDFREKLDDLAEDNDEVQDLIDAIDEDPDCSSVIFDSDAPDSTGDDDADPTPTKAAANKTPSSQPTSAAAKTTNEKWVAGICTSFGGWVKDLETANIRFQGELDKVGENPAEIKRLLVAFLKTGQAETKNLQKEVGALKAPEVKDGAAIQKVFVDASTQLVKVFDDLVTNAEKINTTNAQQTLADVERLSSGIDTAFNSASASFDKLDNYNAPELEQLFDTRPECQDF